MNNRVFGFGGFAVVLQQFFYITGQKYFYQAVYNPFDAVVEVGAGERAVPTIRNPIRFSRNAARYELPPPELDEHGAELRRWLADPTTPTHPTTPTDPTTPTRSEDPA